MTRQDYREHKKNINAATIQALSPEYLGPWQRETGVPEDSSGWKESSLQE